MRVWVLLLSVLASGCAEKLKKPKKKVVTAEVEFFGSWNAGEVKFASAMFVAQSEPCTPVPEKPTRLGEFTLGAPGPLFAEFFIPQGTQGHACVYAFDDSGKVVAVGSSTQNPMRFEGVGEVIFTKLDYALQPL